MAHQASYRVYRPRRFSEVKGQSRTVDTLREAVRQGRLTHAYLFSGPRGTGKTSVARILAKAVNCEALQSDGDPCLSCASCRSIESGQHLDVIEIDAASNRGIDEIRDIKERITHQTAMSRYKVYIIDEVHMLTQDAFNALLKTLEEPPQHVLFILATTEAHKLPVTVLSRCQRYEFKRHTVAVIEEQLRYVAQQEGVQADPAALEVLAEAADGALRDALSLFDQVVATDGALTVEGAARVAGMVGDRDMRRLLEAMVSGIEPMIRVLADLRVAGLDEKLILRDVARQFRDVLVLRLAGPESFPPYRRESLAALSQVMPASVAADAWIDAADLLAQAEARLKGGFPADLAVELALLKVQQRLSGPTPQPVEVPVREDVARRPVPPPAAEAPLTRAAPAVFAEPAVPVTAPATPAPAHTREFQSVLEIVKKERPTTYALFEKAHGVVGSDGVLAVYFEFPAHRELMNQGHNRDVVDRAIKAVYGADMRYDFRVGAPIGSGTSEAPNGTASALADEVRTWFGPDVKLMGFDQ